ncbi:MAG TPA: ribosome-associated translation inhibitor RaiA [Candidatus Saccharimonadales bacterium]|jgi:ribosomal subunit interface protein
MINKLDIDGIHLDVDEKMRAYVEQKVGHLDKYLPKSARESAHAEVMLKDAKTGKDKATCEVNLYLPKEIINVQGSAVNIYVAIDLVEAKLQHRIEKYKQLHDSGRIKRHLANKFRKKAARKASEQV